MVYFFWIASPAARNDGLSVAPHCEGFSRSNPVELPLTIVLPHCAVACNSLKLHLNTLFLSDISDFIIELLKMPILEV